MYEYKLSSYKPYFSKIFIKLNNQVESHGLDYLFILDRE